MSSASETAPLDLHGHTATTLYEAAFATVRNLTEGDPLSGSRGQVFAVDPDIRAACFAVDRELLVRAADRLTSLLTQP